MAAIDARTSTVAASPTVSYVLALIAGVLVVINGILLILTGESLGVMISGEEALIGVAGVAVGLAMLIFAIRLEDRPDQHVRWGAGIILASAISLVLVGGGLLIGFILGLVAGIIAIAWRG
jgi:hypothetical protein